MKNYYKISLAGLFFWLPFGMFAQDNVSVDYTKYPDYKPVTGSYYKPPVRHTDASRVRAVELPRRVDNSEKSYFPPVFNQDEGSCGSASRIGYMFTEEINAFRGTDATMPENMYPTHFTWLLTYHGPGKEGMARDNGIPNMVAYGGRTYSQKFGSQTYESPFGWMSGYDKWFGAMFNRISGTSNIGPINVKENADILKGWLWNHNGDPAFQGRGGIAGIGVASAATLGTISSGKYAGQKFVKYWGTQVDHALTIVGYDDDIWCDVNGDAAQTPDEIGAWIIVNSWGSGWANKGLVYCPYSQGKPTQTATGFWQPELYHVRGNYRPIKTLKVKMDFSHRSELSLSVGVSSNLNATVPERQIALSHFTYCGWRKSNNVTYHDVPMLGQWADGQMHADPMEFGYDLTDLVAPFDQSKPLKYFFIINSSTSATGEGFIRECSVMDYALDEKGIEIPFAGTNVPIMNKGKQTVITTSLQGEPFNAPVNLAWKSDAELSWAKPQYSPYQLVGYKVYKNNTFQVDVTGADMTSSSIGTAVVGDTYQITAVYNVNGIQVESNKSNSLVKLGTATSTAITETGSMGFSNSGFTIPNVFASGMPQCTMEFWMKPSSIRDWNFQIGKSWGSFLFHLNSGGGITVGYTTDNRLDKVSAVKLNEWTHIAVVLDGPSIVLYKNGIEVGRTIDNGNGMPAIASFAVGLSGSGIDGKLDEFRIWNRSLTQVEIQSRKDLLILHPEMYPDLVAYYQMDKELTKLKDSKGKNNASFTGSAIVYAADYPLSQKNNDFTLVDSTCYVGQVLDVATTTSPANTESVVWNAPDGGVNNCSLYKPSFRFDRAGTFEVSKTTTLSTGEVITAKKTVVVQGLQLPEPDFAINKTVVPAGERVSFENKTQSPLCAYQWTMRGATAEQASTVNAAAAYNNAGEYTVTLTATNAAGQKSVSKTIRVEMTAPKADFEAAESYTVKGGSIRFNDRSLYGPQQFIWNMEKGSPAVSTDRNPTVQYQMPGKFRVKLTCSNEKGSDSAQKLKYVIVSNENPGNSLSFDGNNDYLTVSNLFAESSVDMPFTLEWWMKPNANKDNCQIMGTDVFSIKENAKGGLSVGFGDTDRMTVPDGTLEKGSWDHFAFSYKNGAGVFYKNGMVMATRTFTTKTMPLSTWVNGLRIGDASNSADMTIDELRVWNTARTQDELLINLNGKLTDVPNQVALEAYFTFDESATKAPKDYSAHNRTSLRSNIGPEGDMWSASQAFCMSNYVANAFTPNASSTYIVTNAVTGRRFNTAASTTWAEYRTSFIDDGTMQGPCGTATTYGLNGKYVIAGSSEFVIARNANGKWTLRDLNTNYYTRLDQGYMITSSTDNRAALTGFHKNDCDEVRICSTTGQYMQATDEDWNTGGDLQSFSFVLEEVKQVSAATAFTSVSGAALQQLRFSSNSQLTGTPVALQGSVSYGLVMSAGKWYPLHFAAPLEEVTFQGKYVLNDTVRMGGKMFIGKDFEVRKYANGQLVAVNSMEKNLPAGSYLIRLKNSSIAGKKVVFRTSRNVTFKDTPALPVANSLCGSDMARNAAIENISGYYRVNTTGDKMAFTAGSLSALSPFEAYVPYFGDAATAPAEIDLNGDALAGIGDQPHASDPVRVWTDNGLIKVEGTDSLYRIYTVSGMVLPVNKRLTSGCYLVIVDNKAYKVIVR